jgi:succinoglycan biosynthesis protein ExoM
MKIVVTVCTRQRPEMLRRCLDSLIVQEVPASLRLTIVVVENDIESGCRVLVEQVASRAGSTVMAYGHEPTIGIPYARNRSVQLALRYSPDWIAFIDDDEIAAPDWLAKLAAATSMLDADVLQGPVVAKYPPKASPFVQKEAKRRPTGTRLDTAYTNNTLMRVSIVRDDGLALRFDETMRFSGGSDAEFFFRAAARGAVIRWVDEAVVTELVPMERLTLAWQLARARRTGANRFLYDIRRKGVARTIASGFIACLGKVVSAGLEMPVALAVYPISARLAGRMIFRALRKLWWSVGHVGAALGIEPQPYVRVEGN